MKKLIGIVCLLFMAGVSFAAPHVFPVPFVATQHTSIKFTDLPGSGEIKIYTIAGEEVKRLSIPPGGFREWDVTNASGKKVVTGVYLYIVDGDGQKSSGKIVVIR